MVHLTGNKQKISRRKGMQVVHAAMRARKTGAQLTGRQANLLLAAFADDFDYMAAVRKENQLAATTANGWRKLRMLFQCDLRYLDRQSAKRNVYKYMESMVGQVFVFKSDLLY